jgi:hypothetical protein
VKSFFLWMSALTSQLIDSRGIISGKTREGDKGSPPHGGLMR